MTFSRTARLLCWPAVCSALLLAACGGGSDDKPNVLTLTAILGAEGGFEGTRDGPGNVVEPAAGLDVGDREGEAVPSQKGPVKAFLSFDLSPLPAGATLTSARLELNLVNVLGNPTADLGDLMADLVIYGPMFPDGLTYVGNTQLGNLAVITSNSAPGVKSASVLFGVNQIRAMNLTRFQVRLRFRNAEQNFDAQDTRLEFEDAESSLGTGAVPLLIIVYEIPNP